MYEAYKNIYLLVPQLRPNYRPSYVVGKFGF